MARVTVEDCLDNVDNRFELVLVASKRARQLANGKPPMLEWENDKVTVMALREIAEGHITASILTEEEVEEEEEFLMEGQAPMTDSETTTETGLSSDELLASQVEALLAASNDILGGVTPTEDASASAANVADDPSTNSANVADIAVSTGESVADNTGFSANLLNSAFMKSDSATTPAVDQAAESNSIEAEQNEVSSNEASPSAVNPNIDSDSGDSNTP